MNHLSTAQKARERTREVLIMRCIQAEARHAEMEFDLV